ncbi:hypothetical protein M9H77_15672 [Catharanthus roseus]|uniref:Uncharacterized protein n=1 Tax=Catharanthus roseus TaxID=4058 RepID=A0ACC0B048_CATRO|nr:hypothetical protein M9H77_15672 [Catharanthus roseus]
MAMEYHREFARPPLIFMEEYAESIIRANNFTSNLYSRERKTVCVTSVNSYFGAQLAKKLLAHGYLVRVTIQSPAHFEDMKEFMRKEEISQLESIVLVKMVDLQSLCDAFKGCHAVFHTSAFIDPRGISGYTERMGFLESEGARNVIEACGRAAYVKRCIFTSSLLASIWKSNNVEQVLDENCWSDEEFCRDNKLWLALGKTRAEKAAWRTARELKVNLVTVCPGLLMAPSFPNAQPETSIPYLKGGRKMLERGVLAIEDASKVAEAHVRVYEEMDYGACGRYICFGKIISRLEDALQIENGLKMHGLLISEESNVDLSDHMPTNLSNSRLAKLQARASARRIAAASYDYDNDPRWADYWSNVLIPPHMASRPDVVTHFKRKFYQRFIDPDLVVEPMSTGSSSQPRSSARQPSSSSTTPNDQTGPRNGGVLVVESYSNFWIFYFNSIHLSPFIGPTSGTSGASTASAPSSTFLRWDRQTIQFSVHAWVFVVAVLAILPFAPRNLSMRAFRLSFMGTGAASLYSLYSLYGKPRAWNMQAVQVWLQSVIVTKDFIYFIYCLTFVSSNLYLKFALIPILCRAVEHVAKFLRRNFSRSTLYRKYLEEVCVWVESNTTTLNILSSQAEIGNGFILIIALLSWQRNIIQAFMYWQLLRLMYHAPATASYHQSAWAKIGRIVNPLIQQYAPFLNTPLSAIQKWWFR